VNIEECREYLSQEALAGLSDEELLHIRDEIQYLAEVLVEHAMQDNI